MPLVDTVCGVRLGECTFLVLAAVAWQPLPAYEVMIAVRELSAGRVRLRTARLYRTLDRLVDIGWLRVDRCDVTDGRSRLYQITDAGAARLAADVAWVRDTTTLTPVRVRRFAPSPGRTFGR